MSGLSVVGTVYSASGNPFAGISDFEIYEKNGYTFLVVACEGSSDLQMYYLYGDQAPLFRDKEVYRESSGSSSLTDIEIITIDGVDYVMTAGRYDDNLSLLEFAGGIPFMRPGTNITGDAVDYANFAELEFVEIDGKTFVFGAKRNAEGVFGFRIKGDGSFKEKAPHTSDAYLSDLSDIEIITTETKTFLVTVSAFDAGISVFRVGRHGNLHLIDAVSPSDGAGFTHPQEVKFANVQGLNFVLMASATTDSITVYRLGELGNLYETDHKIDSLLTRFEGASNLEVIEFQGRAFVIASGNDDGFTLFELMANGELVEIQTVEDTFETALRNIGAIEATIIDDQIHIVVGSESEHGFTQFVFEPDPIVTPIIGTKEKDTLTGGSGDDTIYGGRRGDTIDGGAGDDLIYDGGGKDFLTGGSGADTFIFDQDNRNDLVMDYEMGVDMLDLSNYDLVNGLNDIEIKSREWGALIMVNGEKIKLYTENGARLQVEDFGADHFIF